MQLFFSIRKEKKKQLEKYLRKEADIVCVECDTLNSKSVCVELRCNALVEKIKNKSCRVIFEMQEEENIEVEDTKKEIENEHALDTRMEYFEE